VRRFRGGTDDEGCGVAPAATILAVKGGALRDITVGDCLELSVVLDGRSVRKNRGMGFYQLLHTMGVFGPDAPSTIRDVLVDYLQDRQPMLDTRRCSTSRRSLGGLFWRDWNAITLASTHCTCNQVSPLGGSSRRCSRPGCSARNDTDAIGGGTAI